ncbi:Yip1 domain [Trinorchestia longiramus]|nr:Yip1 domain [Trinorchestia longiramus]
MASKNFSLVDIEKENDDLQFQDFGLSSSTSQATNSQTHYFTNFPESPGHQTDSQKLLGEYRDDEERRPQGEAETKEASLWTLEYYQRYFDVDTKQVGDRIMWSMIPKPGVSFLELHIRPKPDLYGPFWICLTLVFTAAIAGNISNYLQTEGQLSQHWRYDFHKVSLAAGLVFSYGWLVPLVLYCALRFKTPKPPLSLLHLICLYGYSLSVLVPICIVWAVPVYWLWWCVGIVGVVLSGVVLCKAVWEGLRSGSVSVEEEDTEEVVTVNSSLKNVAVVVVAVVAVLHVAMAMLLMVYFFSIPGGGAVVGSSADPSATLPKNASLPVAAAPQAGQIAEKLVGSAGTAKEAGLGDVAAAPGTGHEVGSPDEDRSVKMPRSPGTQNSAAVVESSGKFDAAEVDLAKVDRDGLNKVDVAANADAASNTDTITVKVQADVSAKKTLVSPKKDAAAVRSSDGNLAPASNGTPDVLSPNLLKAAAVAPLSSESDSAVQRRTVM